MTRLTVTVVATLILYLAYHTLAAEALPSGSNPKPLMNSGGDETAENMLSDENFGKLQSAWLKSALKRRLSSSSGSGTAGAYSVLRRAPVAAAGKIPLSYLADMNLLDDEDTVQKRFDDYGHMRFGKRGGEGDQFDDYGHMRFGRR